MLDPWFLGFLLIGVGGFGVAFVHLDIVIRFLYGRYWRWEERWIRYAIGLGLMFLLLGLVAVLVPPSLVLPVVLPQGAEWAYVFLAVGLTFYLGISLSTLLLREAGEVIRAIIEGLFPPGGAIPYGAEDIDAAERALSFLERVEGPYRELLYVLATWINSPLMSWMLVASFRRFTALSPEERQFFLRKWTSHENLVVRSLSHAFKALGCLGYYSDPRVWEEMGYPGPFVPRHPDAMTHDHEIRHHFHHEGPSPHAFGRRPKVNPEERHPEVYGIARLRRRKRPYRVVKEDMRVKADVCIIGSGAGGGVLAQELSRNPDIQKVVVLERGGYYEGEDFNQRELDMIRLLWKGGALTFTRDFTILIGQGETLGGTTVINHAICIDTPPVVLEEWREMGAGEWMTDPIEFTRVLNEVKGEIHVNLVHEKQINRNNLLLERGAKAVGIEPDGHGINPRNCLDCMECGFSHLGCHYDAKQSALVTYIPAALDTGKCTVFCDTWARRVTQEGGGATGVEAAFMSRRGKERHRLLVDAELVVVAAGAVSSTALLLRSKLPDPYRQLGKGLSIHPSPLVIAEFDEEVRAYQGIPMSYNVSEYSVLHRVPGVGANDPLVPSDRPDDRKGGFMLESVFPNLGQFAAFLPGMGAEHKALMSHLNHYAAAGILIRDTPKGVVSVNPSGDPVVDYALDQYDRRNLSDGMRTLAELYFEAGAKRVIVTHRDPNIIERDEYLRNSEVITERIRPDNCGQDRLYLGSVHPQGGNRLGRDPRTSVVDEHGFHHQVRNLVVCDASVFPTATGVNPMLTIMGMAKRTAEYINAHWRELAP